MYSVLLDRKNKGRIRFVPEFESVETEGDDAG